MIDLDTQERQLAALVSGDPTAHELTGRFQAAGHELYLVGGSVRDALLRGAPGEDLDFATSARPDGTEALLRGWADEVWLTGARFGTVSARRGDARIEITTYRSERYGATSRHPDVTFGDDLETDLSRRDFTCNAMAVDVRRGRFVDPFGGLADLRAGVLRTPLPAEVSFADDPLRMVRLARFAATLDARVDGAAARAATALADRLATISAERLRDELVKLVCGDAVGRGVDVLCDTGLADHFLPELPALRMQRDPAHHHKDVYAHTVAVIRRCPADDAVLRLAALFHDVGKPATRRFVAGGRVTFHHHEVVGAKLTRRRMAALKFPRRTIDEVSRLVELHLRFHGYREQGWTDAAVRRYVRDAGDDAQLRRLNLLTRADVTTQNRRKARALAAAMDDLEERIEQLRRQEELDALRPPLDGHEIMRHLGIGPGPLVGAAYRHLLELRIERGPMTAGQGRTALDAWWASREG